MMGAYSRWELIRGWALIRISTVFKNFGINWKQQFAGGNRLKDHPLILLWWNFPRFNGDGVLTADEKSMVIRIFKRLFQTCTVNLEKKNRNLSEFKRKIQSQAICDQQDEFLPTCPTKLRQYLTSTDRGQVISFILSWSIGTELF